VGGRYLAGFVFVWANCSVTTAQLGQPLEFDVASVKLSPARESFTSLDRGGPESPTPGNWSCEYYTLRDVLVRAFAVDASQISGPAWMDNQRVHISAKMPPATTRAQFREMLRSLLTERFALKAHLETRVVARYELAIASSGHKLRKTVERAAPTQQTNTRQIPALDADGFPKAGPPSDVPEILTIMGRTRMFFPGTTMKEFAEELSFKLRTLVVDTTGLEGKYDIGLHWSDNDSGPSLPQSLRDQLGLRLVEKKGSADFVVVEHLEKLPTGN
jgi:uncharacterized protein (TIGR03435 family)